MANRSADRMIRCGSVSSYLQTDSAQRVQDRWCTAATRIDSMSAAAIASGHRNAERGHRHGWHRRCRRHARVDAE
jgi:hypothetical protein